MENFGKYLSFYGLKMNGSLNNQKQLKKKILYFLMKPQNLSHIRILIHIWIQSHARYCKYRYLIIDICSSLILFNICFCFVFVSCYDRWNCGNFAQICLVMTQRVPGQGGREDKERGWLRGHVITLSQSEASTGLDTSPWLVLRE